MRKLHPAAKSVWMIKYALFTTVVVLAIGAYEITQLFSTADRVLPVGTYTGTVLALGALITIGIPLLRYKYWRFTLMDEELFLERGILNRVRTVVPLRRIQHLDVSQDVLEREFDLGKLIVHTAGTRSADVVVPGLAYAEAERFRDDLRNYITEDAL
ncbi:MAG: PH domain-containing protein [Bacteroidetes bacterium]|jgi:membrane protein YdbS with pleckstrin-like domain|nr:PH domain-containing protein [Bacteroidota bacterium]